MGGGLSKLTALQKRNKLRQKRLARGSQEIRGTVAGKGSRSKNSKKRVSKSLGSSPIQKDKDDSAGRKGSVSGASDQSTPAQYRHKYVNKEGGETSPASQTPPPAAKDRKEERKVIITPTTARLLDNLANVNHHSSSDNSSMEHEDSSGSITLDFTDNFIGNTGAVPNNDIYLGGYPDSVVRVTTASSTVVTKVDSYDGGYPDQVLRVSSDKTVAVAHVPIGTTAKTRSANGLTEENTLNKVTSYRPRGRSISDSLFHINPDGTRDANVIDMQKTISIEKSKKKKFQELNSLLEETNVVIDLNELDFVQVVGHGAFSEVWEGYWCGYRVAIKRLKLTVDDARFEERFLREVENLRKGNHPNVVMFFGVCLKPPCIVTEYMAGGNLYNLLHPNSDSGPVLSFPLVMKMATDLAVALLHLHSLSILHRDLTPLNILLDEVGNVKISDFGLSREKAQEGSMTMTLGGICNPRWRPPEITKNKGHYSEKIDVYCFALLVWEMLTSQIPFADLDGSQAAAQVAYANLRPPIPDSCHPQLRDLIERCWHDDPNQRPDFENIVLQLRSITWKNPMGLISPPLVTQSPRFNRVFSDGNTAANRMSGRLIDTTPTSLTSSINSNTTSNNNSNNNSNFTVPSPSTSNRNSKSSSKFNIDSNNSFTPSPQNRKSGKLNFDAGKLSFDASNNSFNFTPSPGAVSRKSGKFVIDSNGDFVPSPNNSNNRKSGKLNFDASKVNFDGNNSNTPSPNTSHRNNTTTTTNNINNNSNNNCNNNTTNNNHFTTTTQSPNNSNNRNSNRFNLDINNINNFNTITISNNIVINNNIYINSSTSSTSSSSGSDTSSCSSNENSNEKIIPFVTFATTSPLPMHKQQQQM